MTIKHLLENTRVKAALLILGGVFALALVVAGVKAVGNQVDSKILGYTNQQAQPFVITSNASGVATTTEFFGDVSPRVDGVYNLGSAAKRWANLFVSSITPSGSIIPDADNTYDLGSLALRWRSGFFGTSVSSTQFISGNGNGSPTVPLFRGPDSDSGIYFVGGTDLTIARNGTTRVQADSSGTYFGSAGALYAANNSVDLGRDAFRFRTLYLATSQIFSSGATGIQLYNTADETTNFERGSIGFVSNVLTFTTAAGGSGTTRDLRFAPSSWEAGSGINISSSGGGICFICFVRTYSNANTSLLRVSGTNTASSNDSEALNLAVTVNQSGTAAYNVLDVNPTITSTGSGGVKLIRGAVGGSERFSVADTGKITLYTTVTAGGTTGAQTINKPSGCVNFAAAATSLVVTNSLVSASSIVLPSVQTNDTTLKSVQAVPTSGSFTLYASAAATGETKVCFVVMN